MPGELCMKWQPEHGGVTTKICLSPQYVPYVLLSKEHVFLSKSERTGKVKKSEKMANAHQLDNLSTRQLVSSLTNPLIINDMSLCTCVKRTCISVER